MGMRPDGRELLVVVIKGTFGLPENGESTQLAAEQMPLVEADEYTGEPGFSAPLYESDYSPEKPYCDVILNGSAYAPGGKPASEVGVGVKVGRVAKAFNVIGDRVWESSAAGIGTSFAKPFIRKEISYNVAFGGTDRFSEDEAKHDAFMLNPSGIGYRRGLTSGPIDGTPVPNTEERKNPVKSPIGDYRSMAFGPIARGWPNRARYAGTYDDEWLENVFPFLPEDFDNRYFQCAPEDQQTDHLRGGEEVTLVNLTPDCQRVFHVPRIDLPVVFCYHDSRTVNTVPAIDTLLIEPDHQRFSVVWRSSIPLRQNMFEIVRVVAGRKPNAWWRAREMNKTYYPGLAAAVRAKGRSVRDDVA